MLTVIIGTRAQLIKMAPILVELESRNEPFCLIFTGQHHATMDELLSDFGIVTRPVHVYSGLEISGIRCMLSWMPMVLYRLIKQRRILFRDKHGHSTTVVVHGDTFSTLLGALAGKLAGCRIAHVESGLRSFSLMNPFPEELTRLLVFRMTNLAFCPGEWAVNNMSGYKLETINTGQNTLLDALRIAVPEKNPGPTQSAGFERYCVVSVHRFENIFRSKRLNWIVDALEGIAQDLDVIFVLHPATGKRLRAAGLFERLNANRRIHLRKRMSYVPFVRLLKGSDFVMTDGGSNQEELHYMRKPTLILRNATERPEGIGQRAALCGFERNVLDEFLKNIKRQERDEDITIGDIHPSRCIVNRLQKIGGMAYTPL